MTIGKGEFVSQGIAGTTSQKKRSNLLDLLRGYLDSLMSPFPYSVMSIVSPGPQEKMIRPNTISNVTLMTNVKSICDWAYKKFITGSVGKNKSAIDLNSTVAVMNFTGSPMPTSFSLFDMRKKTIFEVHGIRSH